MTKSGKSSPKPSSEAVTPEQQARMIDETAAHLKAEKDMREYRKTLKTSQHD